MKKLLISIGIALVAMSASADVKSDLISLLTGSHKTSKTTTQKKESGNIDDPNFKSVSLLYSEGKISADSVINIGLHLKTTNPELSARYLKLAADSGNPQAMMELGSIYVFSPEFSGQKEEGLNLLNDAVKNGYSGANDYLGLYYFQNKDYDKAKKYFDARKYDHYGFAYAALGSMYLEGNGVAEDGKKARENYRQAALKGYSRGMSLYANLLGTKNGGSLNYPDAFLWHYIAGDLGENYSRVMLYRPRIPEKEANGEVAKDAQVALQWIEMVHKGRVSKMNRYIRMDFFRV